MADCNYVDKHEIGSFIKDVPQDVVEKHLNDPILITFACNADTFTRSDILREARKAGIKMSSSTAWLNKCMQDKVVLVYENKSSDVGEKYYMGPAWWLEFMRVLDNREVKKQQAQYARLLENAMLSIAVNEYMHGLDYLSHLESSQNFYFMIEEDSVYMRNMYEIARHPFMMDIIKLSVDSVRGGVAIRFYHMILCYIIFEYVLNRMSVLKRIKVRVT